MLRRNTAILIAFVLLLGTVLNASAFEDKKDEIPSKEGYVLDFSSEFDSDTLNTDSWLAQYLPHCTADSAGSSARYLIENGYLNLCITKDSPDYFGGQPCSADPGNLLWAANGIQTWEKNNLHPGGKQQRDVEPFEGYATQYGYFEIRMKLPDTGGGGYASWWLIGTQDDAGTDGTGSSQNGEIDIFETFFDSPGMFEPKVHAWDDPELNEWSDRVNLDGKPSDYKENFHTYAMDWRPEGITFFVDGKAVAETIESPRYRMCMILSMYINSDFSGWDGPKNKYPMEWLIDYVRVYKDRNGYDESNRLKGFERFIKDAREYLISLWQRFVSFIDAFCEKSDNFFRKLFGANKVVIES